MLLVDDRLQLLRAESRRSVGLDPVCTQQGMFTVGFGPVRTQQGMFSLSVSSGKCRVEKPSPLATMLHRTFGPIPLSGSLPLLPAWSRWATINLCCSRSWPAYAPGRRLRWSFYDVRVHRDPVLSIPRPREISLAYRVGYPILRHERPPGLQKLHADVNVKVLVMIFPAPVAIAMEARIACGGLPSQQYRL